MSTQESGAEPLVFGGNENQEVEAEEEEEYESNDPGPSRKRHKASNIWGGGIWRILEQPGSSAKCSACKRILANSGKSGASLLVSHHSNVNRPDFNAARRVMAMFIISTGQPPSLVEDSGFQRTAYCIFAHGRNPPIPMSRAILDRDVLNLYEREKGTLKCIISEASGALSFSVDHRKSKPTGDKYVDDTYICVTVCFVDADWYLQRRVVGFRLLDFPYDAPSVAETVASCFHDLDVDKKVTSITFDNTLHDASVASSLKTLLQDEVKLLFDGELCHIHCCTEILNSAVQAGLELIADVINKIRGGLHYIAYASTSVVHWDVTYKMLGCALHYKDALNHFASTNEFFLSHFHLDDEEWKKVATMEKFLKVIYDMTCTFLSKESKTASLYFLGVYKVYRLLDVTKGQENFMSAMVKEIKGNFDKYWSEYSIILACTAVLDPRYKLNLISYCFRKIYGDADASQHVDRVVALLKRLFTEYEKSSSSSSVGTSVLECHTKDDLFDDYSPPKQISELDWYLESPVMDLNVDLDLLKFWSGMSKCYIDLANLARDILAIPISTVGTKSAFTIGEKVLSRRRRGLCPDLLEMLICLHDWTCPKDRNGIALSAVEWYGTNDEDKEDDEVENSIEVSDDEDEEDEEVDKGHRSSGDEDEQDDEVEKSTRVSDDDNNNGAGCSGE